MKKPPIRKKKTLLDTADMYGVGGANDILLGKALRNRPRYGLYRLVRSAYAGSHGIDRRKHFTRFQGESFQKNRDIVSQLEEISSVQQVTASQVALAWVLHQGKDFVPIPGTRKSKNLIENIAALNVNLSAGDLIRINEIASQIAGDFELSETTLDDR
ncbi:aldo/keto reductase [Brevibacillus nitrificans]|uniref:aldo/keto reductase n=1 Tax=Brevibacillus nitrificans TaxID=651560 RepID=UPI00285B27B1|nr:aldo/keto reductase [Brevibacillus nitrificans]MDR7318819.1 aryl-alcohol dehydrogenase-like predicted oxidoreductase [Brevibacillus nitrificans]